MRLDMPRFFVAFAGAVTLAVCSIPAHASTVFFNSLGGASTAADSVGEFGPLYQSFSTGSTPVSQIDVKVELYGSGTPVPTVSLFSDSNTSPGTLIFTFGKFIVNATSGTVYDLSGYSVPLAANTRYWIQVSTSNPGIFWGWTSDTSGTGVSGQYFDNNIVGVTANYPYLMEVSGVTAAVPEPPVLPLFALGFLAMAFLGRRRFAR